MILENKCSISIILPVYNEPISWVEECINSLLKQTFQDFELIIVLDNPNNIELKEYISNIATRNAKIVFLVNEVNLGLPKTLNKAIDHCRGNYIARMDADDICYEQRLEKQYTYLINNPGIDLIGCNIEKIDESGKLIGDMFSRPLKHKSIMKFLKHSQPICHPTWMGKKEVFKKLRYNTLLGVEDMDFLCRAVLNKFKLANLPDKLLKYRVRSTSISKSNSLRQLVCTKYIAKMYVNALENRNDYSLKDIKYIEISEEESKKYALEEETLNFLIRSIKEERSIISIFKFLFLAIKSKHTFLKVNRRIKCEFIVLQEKIISYFID